MDAVHDQRACRLACSHVEKVAVDGRDHIDAARTFRGSCLVPHIHQRPLSARIIIAVAGDERILRHIDRYRI